MAEIVYKKISELPNATVPLAGTEYIEVSATGASKKGLWSGLFGAGWWAKLAAAFTAFKAPDSDHADSADTLGGEAPSDFHDATQLVGAVPLANIPENLTGKYALANGGYANVSRIVKLTTPGSGTWTVPANVTQLKVICAGGGGGGGGGASYFSPTWYNGTPGSAGGTTTFGALSADGGLGGGGGQGSANIPGHGGLTRSGVAGSVGGHPGAAYRGGCGGGSGGGAGGANGAAGVAGGAGAGGGGGGGYPTGGPFNNGGGGGSGTILSEESAKFVDVTPGQLIAYSVGAGGAAGSNGGAGGSGIIIIEY